MLQMIFPKQKFRNNITLFIFIWGLFFCVTTVSSQSLKPIGLPVDFSGGNEYDPVLNNRGDKLAFISDKSGTFKLYISNFADGEWETPKGIDVINEFGGGIGNIHYPSFNYDGSIIYFEADFNKDSSDVDIFYSEYINDEWTAPVSVGAPINTLEYDGQPSISSNDNGLYFVRNNKNAEEKDYVCRTIYYTEKDVNNQNWLKPKKLPLPININCEQAPKIGIDNKTLYYSSVREGGKGGFDIYKTKLIAKNVWVPAEGLDTLNTEFNDFSPSISFDSKIGYYSISSEVKREIVSKIYKQEIPSQFLPGKSTLLNGIVTDLVTQKPLEIDIKVYDPYTSWLLYEYKSNEQRGAYEFFLPAGRGYKIDYQKKGYSHLFYSTDLKNLSKNNLVTKDIQLFSNIKLLLNVFDDEIYGAIDAKIEVRDKDSILINTTITKIGNGRYVIELPIDNEYQIGITADFFESKAFSFDLNEIVQFDEFEVDVELNSRKVDFEITVIDEDTKTGIPVEVVLTNLDNNEIIKTVATPDSDGKYKIQLRDGDRYNVSVSPKGYSFYNTTVNLKKKDGPQKLKVELKQLKEDTKLTLNNITFETNSKDLNESSYVELDRVSKLMRDNPDIKIEISAHTDDAGSNSYNLRLSEKRAKSVVMYLLESNIEIERLISKGYGELKPIVPNDSDENKAKNRRVELKILEIGKS